MNSEPCCEPGSPGNDCCVPPSNVEPLTEVIREKYAETARSGLSSDNGNPPAFAAQQRGDTSITRADHSQATGG